MRPLPLRWEYRQETAVHSAAGVLPQNQVRGEGTIEANRDSRNMQMAHRRAPGVASG